jgi:predicted signal transduction protein with EAL and GGDEF domain
MTQQHTPGPWSLRRSPESVPNVEYWVDGPNGALIADIKTHSTDTTYSDARRIAAAPELLAALQADYDLMTDERLDQDLIGRRVGAAIAKARGE